LARIEDPGASSGIDLDSEIITELAIECPNIFGVKLTYVFCFNRQETPLKLNKSCGNVGKLTRIADVVHGSKFSTTYPRKNPNAKFVVLGGFVDFLTPSAFANAHGAITGLANFAPVCSRSFFGPI